MNLAMSMFATQADYWKARAELAEGTIAEVANELGCEPDNEAMLRAAHSLKTRCPFCATGGGSLTDCDMDEDESR